MTIQCRTGCKEQITYKQYSFPDGFIYFLPLNLDETIHDCPNVPHNTEVYVLENELPLDEKIPDNYRKAEFELELHSERDVDVDFTGSEWDGSELEKLPEEIKKNALCMLQTMCLLFPSPFKSMYGYNSETKEHYSDLNRLSNYYESLGEFESAMTARLIQDKITHDQSEKIIELFNKTKHIPDVEQEEILKIRIDALELRDKYFRKVENLIKSFIRKKYYVINEFQKDFPRLFSDANNQRSNPSKHIIHKHDDVIEFLSFGSCVYILKTNKKNKKDWAVMDWEIINQTQYIVERRNDMDHYSDDKLDESISKETKAVGFLFSKFVIDFFEKIEHV